MKRLLDAFKFTVLPSTLVTFITISSSQLKAPYTAVSISIKSKATTLNSSKKVNIAEDGPFVFVALLNSNKGSKPEQKVSTILTLLIEFVELAKETVIVTASSPFYICM